MEIHARISEESVVEAPMHTHTQNEIIVNKSGHGILIVDGAEYELEPHTVACIPSGVPHSDSSTDLRVSGTISFPSDGGNDLRCVEIFTDRGGMFEKLLDLAAPTAQHKDPYSVKLLNALGDAVLALLQLRGLTETASTDNDDIIDRFDQEIRKNYMNPDFDIAKEIEKTGYSPNHFRQVYKKVFGHTPREQLLYTRMEYSKSLMRLRGNLLTINQIALKSGFKDPNHFSKVFHQYEGITPREYMAQCRNGSGQPTFVENQ